MSDGNGEQKVERPEVSLHELDYDYHGPRGRLYRRLLRTLEGIAFPKSGSVWVMKTTVVPWTLLHELTEAGHTWDVQKLDATETEKTLVRAVRELSKKVEAARARCEESLASAERKAATATEEAGGNSVAIDEARKAYTVHCQRALRKAEQRLADAAAAAAAFGVELGLPLVLSRSAVEGLRSLAHAKARSYAQMAEQARGTPLADAAANNEVPPMILADYVEEKCDGDATAAREAFADAV